MKEQEYHNNPWAEKLQNLQTPDVQQGWRDMRLLLDQQMPVTKPDRRWIYWVLLLLLLTGVCTVPVVWKQAGNLRVKQSIQPANESPIVKIEVEVDTTEGRDDTGTMDSVITRQVQDIPAQPANGDAKVLNKAPKPASRLVSDSNASNKPPVNDMKKYPDAGIRAGDSKTGDGLRNGDRTGASRTANTAEGIKNNRLRSAGFGDSITGGRPEDATSVSSDRSAGTSDSIRLGKGKKPVGNRDTASGYQPLTPPGPIGNDSLLKKDSIAGEPKLPVVNIDVASAREDSNRILPADTAGKKDTTALPEGKSPVVKQDSSGMKTAAQMRKSDRGFAVAAGFNQFFTVAGQQRSTFNSSGESGSWLDYLPVPQLRYHFNSYLYMTAEAQFNAPQYTRQVAISHRRTDTNILGQRVLRSVFVKKLFYFNLPVSVHVTQVKNLNIGLGMQFSRLTNAVGLFQETQQSPNRPDIVQSAKIAGIKGDTSYHLLKTQEWRFLTDVSYNYKRFLLGARYNHALRPFVNLPLSSVRLEQARNHSLQVYVRYTIWDQRR
jgi:hypothetical protein